VRWTELILLKIVEVEEGSCDRGNEPTGPIKCLNFRVTVPLVSSGVLVSRTELEFVRFSLFNI
jgi:hypothetical protein